MNDIDKILQLIDSMANLNHSAIRKLAALQPVHIQVLQYLQRCNRFSDTPSAVTQYLGLTKGTTSQSIKLLEREAYIGKEIDAEDKRVVHLRLTAKGKKEISKLEKQQHWTEAAKSLNPANLLQVRQSLEKILFEYQAKNGFRSFGQCQSCRHLVRQPQSFQCGLTQANLSKDDTLKICVEHEYLDNP